MIQLTTPVDYPAPRQRIISYANRLFFMGSCFSVEVGEYMRQAGFRTEINPFGIVYNPLSIAQGVERLLDGTLYGAEELFLYDGLYHSADHHGAFSHASESETLEHINHALRQGRDALMGADCLLFTWGTAFVYSTQEDDRVVSNCHKLPERYFHRRMVSVDTLLSVWIPIIERLIASAPERKILLTVSPVRHLRDGAVGNQQSKATLILFCKALVEHFSDHVYYFPAYEIMMDELRDYRYYADDMTHPSSVAVSIIRQRFADLYIAQELHEAMDACLKLRRRMAHRPLHPDSPDAMLFETQTETLITALRRKYPDIVLDDLP
ncbi:GSCFA domain-containing protein [Porphyromonas loveana]|uniref:GSCFA domain-containing protein n=1 Tax=Porphyromonas loveana TaxID=1884669 RepID=UPI0035A0ED87